MKDNNTSRPLPMDRLANEIKLRIISYLEGPSAISLALVNHQWQNIAESVLWRNIDFQPELFNYTGSGKHCDCIWIDIKRTLERRPRLRPFVKTIKAYFTADNIPHIARILELCRETMQQVTYEDFRSGSLTRNSSVTDYFSESGITFPRLHSLSRPLSHQDLSDTFLRRFPQLERLQLTLHRDESQARLRDVTSLERLRRFTIRGASRYAFTLAIDILAVASGLRVLTLPNNRDPSSVFPPSLLNIKCLWSSASITSLMIENVRVCELLLDAWAESPENFMPDLENLSINHPFHRTGLPPHKNLSFINLGCVEPGRPPRIVDSLGANPADQVTGLIAPWLIDSLAQLPKLRVVALVFAMRLVLEQQDWWATRGAFNVQSYANGSRKFYRIVAELEQVHGFLRPHHFAYTAHAANFEDLGDEKRYHEGSGAVELTWYRGYPVPTSLLCRFAEICDRDSWLSGHGRDLTLPDGAWQLLDGWYEEVTHSMGDLDRRQILALMNHADFDEQTLRGLIPWE